METTAMVEAMEANDVLLTKGIKGETPTAQEYEVALNLNERVLHEATDIDTALMCLTLIPLMWEAAVLEGYTVVFDDQANTFTVTEEAAND